MTSGNLYIIHMLGTQYYKIGVSRDSVQNRAAELQTGNPFKLIPLAEYRVRDMRIAEHVVHAKFNSQRVRGEWFLLPLAQYDEYTLSDVMMYITNELDNDTDERIRLLLLDSLCPYCSRSIGGTKALQKAIEKGYCTKCNPMRK